MAETNSITTHATKVRNACPGEVLLQSGLAAEALPFLLASAHDEPHEWRHHSNLAVAYRFLGRYDEAREAVEQAAKLNPEGWQVYHTWANVMDELGDYLAALGLRRRSWELTKGGRQEVALGLAVSLLRQGEWKEAWPYWEMGRFLYSWAPPQGMHPWQGEDLTGKRVMVVSEGGYGDAFDQTRWLPALVSEGAEVTLFVWDRQVELLRQSPTLRGVTVTSLNDHPDTRNFDYATSILSLAAQFHATPEDVPPPLTFSFQPTFKKEVSGRRLGLCWKAEENGSPRSARSIPVRHVNLFETVDAEWYSLVPNVTLPWTKPSPDNWLDTARLIQTLDGVVSVDTAVAHLAGCLGVPVVLLIPLNAEWRWLTGRTDTVWYPKHRLIRQRKPEEWAEPIEEAVRLVQEGLNAK